MWKRQQSLWKTYKLFTITRQYKLITHQSLINSNYSVISGAFLFKKFSKQGSNLKIDTHSHKYLTMFVRGSSLVNEFLLDYVFCIKGKSSWFFPPNLDIRRVFYPASTGSKISFLNTRERFLLFKTAVVYSSRKWHQVRKVFFRGRNMRNKGSSANYYHHHHHFACVNEWITFGVM